MNTHWNEMGTLVVAGGVRLRGELAQERGEHHDRLHAVPVHLRRHRSPAVQGPLLLLHRRVETHCRRVQVRHFVPRV